MTQWEKDMMALGTPPVPASLEELYKALSWFTATTLDVTPEVFRRIRELTAEGGGNRYYGKAFQFWDKTVTCSTYVPTLEERVEALEQQLRMRR